MKNASEPSRRVLYLDASALVKRVVDEAETEALEAYLSNARMATSELSVTEVTRAVRRMLGSEDAATETALRQWDDLMRETALVPIDRSILEVAGAIDVPALKSLDAIHLVSALDLDPIEAFVTYDKRQAAAARRAGLDVAMPGRQ